MSRYHIRGKADPVNRTACGAHKTGLDAMHGEASRQRVWQHSEFGTMLPCHACLRALGIEPKYGRDR